jgi:cytochrome c
MKFTVIAAVAGVFAAGAAFAQDGDAAAGEKLFNQCQTCHVVVNEAGETLAGRNAKTGPNLYAVSGRTAGTVEGFRYSESMVAAGEKGLVWDQDLFVAYVQDPTPFLREYLEDTGARGSMAFKVRSEEDAKNLYAFLASLAPATN